MGSCVDKNQHTNNAIRVITLNYSGIINSPFQFFSQEGFQKQSQLSLIFDSLLRRQQIYKNSKQNFKWQMGKIDQKMQKQRYSPVYVEAAGVQDNKFLSEKDFKEIWHRKFNQNFKKSFEVTEQEKQRAMIFDLLCYKTFLTYLYGDQSIEENIIENIINQKKSTLRYLQFAKNAFEKPYLDDTKKMEITIRILKETQISIIFLQQANLKFIQLLKKQLGRQYLIKGVEKGNSIVMLNKSLDSIDKTQKLLTDQQIKKQLNWNEDTAFLFTQKFILISGHLSSKKQKNQYQIIRTVDHLLFLKKHYPKHKIIVGADFNNESYPVIQGYQRYPQQQTNYTTRKKRTYMQAQYNKAEQQSKKRSDYIISSFPMKKTFVYMLQNLEQNLNQKSGSSKSNNSNQMIQVTSKSIKQIFLPNNDHPFDHFLVYGQFDYNKIK